MHGVCYIALLVVSGTSESAGLHTEMSEKAMQLPEAGSLLDSSPYNHASQRHWSGVLYD